jgi:hypothetical protein
MSSRYIDPDHVGVAPVMSGYSWIPSASVEEAAVRGMFTGSHWFVWKLLV